MILRFFDLETRGYGDLKEHGLQRYVEELTAVTLVTWQDVNTDTKHISEVKVWEPLYEPRPHFSDAIWVAYNARFDRLCWNKKLGHLDVEQVLDLAVKCRASGLPDGLDRVARELGLEDKKAKGAMLRIADANKPLPPRDSAIWREFVEYGKQDTALLWPIWLRTRVVRKPEWLQWFASERINDRGLPVNLETTARLHEQAKQEDEKNNSKMLDLCGLGINQSKELIRWVWDRLPEASQELMVVEGRRSLNSKTVLPQLLGSDLPPMVREVLEALEGAKNPRAAKTGAILRYAVLGRVHGAYVFHGALTGRYSSRGVQVHNFPRGGELRGCFEAGPGKTLVWGDWAAIEARALPWLAYNPGGRRTAGRHAEEVLARFRRGEDLYVAAAQQIYGITGEVTKEQRFVGKVAVLACGYGGGWRAYMRMARAYGVEIAEDKAQEIVQLWREANPWAVWFWSALEAAMAVAWAAPGSEQAVGRVVFTKAGNDLLCALPSGRNIVYRGLHRSVEEDQWGRRRPVWRYARGVLYGGLLSENLTQATAADLLRDALTRVPGAVGHVHDEIIVETSYDEAQDRAKALQRIMESPPIWAEGLPLRAEVEIAERYGKK